MNFLSSNSFLKAILLLLSGIAVFLVTYVFWDIFSEKKYDCYDRDYPIKKYSLITNSNNLSILGSELIEPLEFIECKSNGHESKYELNNIGCKNTSDDRLWSFNKITGVLTTEKSYAGIRQQILICKKI